MIRAGIIGTTGYGARELLRLLAVHPGFEVTAVVSQSAAGRPLGEILPAFTGLYALTCEAFNAASLAERCDVVFLGVPSTKSMGFVKQLRAASPDLRIIDIGPDFRLRDASVFEQYYGAAHEAPELIAEAVYGFVPMNRGQVAAARLVAVPGCYPLSALTPLWPLMDAPLSDVPIVIDAISGVSGAGSSLSEGYHFPEMNENAKAYGIATHRHTPEMEQALGGRHVLQFTPHVGPWTRGILTTITLRPAERFDAAEAYRRYADEPFIRVRGAGALPELKHVRGTNFCDFGWVLDERTGNLIVVSALDNLCGGTAGMAVQCANLMFGMAETDGLGLAGMAP